MITTPVAEYAVAEGAEEGGDDDDDTTYVPESSPTDLLAFSTV